MLQALIFDVDGTLSETEEAHRQAFNDAFRHMGLDWYWDQDLYTRLLQITGGKERMDYYARSLGLSLPVERLAELHRWKTARYAELVAQGFLRLRPGVAELLHNARAAGLKLAVATTTNPPNIEALTQACLGQPMTAVFDVIAAGDMVRHKKPAPDVYHLALEKLGLEAHACLAFEDSENGLKSALAAGLRTIITPSIYTKDTCFDGAALVLDDLTQHCTPEALAAALN